MKIAILGASGRTGRLIVERALASGHEVRVLVRTAAKLALTHPRLEVCVGDSTQRQALEAAVTGCEAVISALGPTSGDFEVCSVTTSHIIALGVPRYVAISGAGLDVQGDDKDFIGKLVSLLVRTFSPRVFRDKVREYELLQASTLAWTLVRPPRLVDRDTEKTARSSLTRSPGASITRAELARFVLAAASDDTLVRKAPFVAS